jgi:hypothetical protein
MSSEDKHSLKIVFEILVLPVGVQTSFCLNSRKERKKTNSWQRQADRERLECQKRFKKEAQIGRLLCEIGKSRLIKRCGLRIKERERGGIKKDRVKVTESIKDDCVDEQRV